MPAKATWIGFHAPIDALVQEIATTDVQVSEGQVLAKLFSPELEHYLNIADRILAALTIAERPFYDGRVDDILAEIPTQIAAADAAAIAESETGLGEKQRWTSLAPYGEFLVKGAEASSQLGFLKVRQKHAGARVADAKAMLVLAKSQLNEERKYLETIRSLLTVKATRACYFRARVAQSSFIKKGIVIGEVSA